MKEWPKMVGCWSSGAICTPEIVAAASALMPSTTVQQQPPSSYSLDTTLPSGCAILCDQLTCHSNRRE